MFGEFRVSDALKILLDRLMLRAAGSSESSQMRLSDTKNGRKSAENAEMCSFQAGQAPHHHTFATIQRAGVVARSRQAPFPAPTRKSHRIVCQPT